MNWEKSCGAVVFTRRDGQLLFAIVQEKTGAYSFHKGHMEGNETEKETARREIFEETGLQPEFVEGFCQVNEYSMAEKPGTWKRVTYYLAEFGSELPIPQEQDIKKILLLSYEQAISLFKYEDTRRILTAAYKFLTQ